MWKYYFVKNGYNFCGWDNGGWTLSFHTSFFQFSYFNAKKRVFYFSWFKVNVKSFNTRWYEYEFIVVDTILFHNSIL
jgi:hypothetical protein